MNTSLETKQKQVNRKQNTINSNASSEKAKHKFQLLDYITGWGGSRTKTILPKNDFDADTFTDVQKVSYCTHWEREKHLSILPTAFLLTWEGRLPDVPIKDEPHRPELLNGEPANLTLYHHHWKKKTCVCEPFHPKQIKYLFWGCVFIQQCCLSHVDGGTALVSGPTQFPENPKHTSSRIMAKCWGQ